jgi:hypothetical protein
MSKRRYMAKKYASILNCLAPDFSDSKKWTKVSEVVEDMVLDMEDRLQDMKRAKSAKYFEEEADEGEEDELEKDGEEEEHYKEDSSKKGHNMVMTQFFEKKFEDKEADASMMKTGVDEIDRYYEMSIEETSKKTLKKMLENMRKIAVYTTKAANGAQKGKKRKREEEEQEEEATKEELEEELADLTNNEPTENKKEIYYDFIDSSEDSSGGGED